MSRERLRDPAGSSGAASAAPSGNRRERREQQRHSAPPAPTPEDPVAALRRQVEELNAAAAVPFAEAQARGRAYFARDFFFTVSDRAPPGPPWGSALSLPPEPADITDALARAEAAAVEAYERRSAALAAAPRALKRARKAERGGMAAAKGTVTQLDDDE